MDDASHADDRIRNTRVTFPRVQPNAAELLHIIAVLMVELDAASINRGGFGTNGKRIFTRHQMEQGRACGPLATMTEEGVLIKLES